MNAKQRCATDPLRNALIIALLVLPPWAFAAVHPLTQTLINILGSALAALFLFQKFSRPPTEPATVRVAALAVLTCVTLFYAALSLTWSADPERTAFTLWTLTGLAALFWSARDLAEEDPAAIARLLRIVLINATLLGLVSIAQRLTAPYEVLWLYRPEVTTYYYVFGPFEYRGTASQFFNLLWPVALGLFLQTRRREILSLALILLVCPAITSSRGGLLMLLVGIIVFLAALQYSGRLPRSLLVLGAIAFLLISLLGSGALQRRWRESGKNVERFLALQGRLRQNDNSWRIISDHPLRGVGPGAYEAAFRAYNFPNAFKPPRNDPKESLTWARFYAMAHNDWLQTLAEWGAPAAAILFITFLFAYLAPLSTPAGQMPLTFGLWTGILLTLLHASFDYPLQNLPIQLLITTFLAFLSAPMALERT